MMVQDFSFVAYLWLAITSGESWILLAFVAVALCVLFAPSRLSIVRWVSSDHTGAWPALRFLSFFFLVVVAVVAKTNHTESRTLVDPAAIAQWSYLTESEDSRAALSEVLQRHGVTDLTQMSVYGHRVITKEARHKARELKAAREAAEVSRDLGFTPDAVVAPASGDAFLDRMGVAFDPHASVDI